MSPLPAERVGETQPMRTASEPDSISSAIEQSPSSEALRGAIEIRLGPNGDVLGLRIVSMSGGTPESWQRMARRLVAAVATRHIASGATLGYSKGVIVTLDIAEVVGNKTATGKPALTISTRVTPAR